MAKPSRVVRPLGRKAARLIGACAVLCSIAAVPPALASPTYSYSTTLSIPGGTFSGYDLATFDATSQLYYLTDRSNNAIDVFSSQSNSFVEQIGSGLFAGTQGGNNDIAGPNGISISNTSAGKLLLAGNGNSSVLAFNLDPAGLTVQGPARSISTAVAGTPSPQNRVDGVAYAPATTAFTKGTILAANNASNPGYLTLIDNNTNAIIKTLLLNGAAGTPNVAGNGVEATIYNTVRGTFFVAVPTLQVDGSGAAVGAGGAIEVDPTTGNILNTYDFNALGLSGSCSPTGLAQGAGASMFIACSDPTASGSVLLDPTGAGSIKVALGIRGGDQASYDPTTNTYFEAARFQPGGPVLGIVDADTLALQTLSIGSNDHSVAVDPVTGQVYVATAATTAFPGCTTGCIGVFAEVPEPGTLLALATSLALMGFGVVRRRRQ